MDGSTSHFHPRCCLALYFARNMAPGPKVVLRDVPNGLDALDAAVFESVSGFSVRLYDAGQLFGNHIALFDRAGACLAGFPIDHADRYLGTCEQVCDSTLAEPFHDMDQGWEILIGARALTFSCSRATAKSSVSSMSP